MRATMLVERPQLVALFKGEVAQAFTATAKREARALEKRIEAATLGAGLGQAMARTWASATYPRGRDVLGPAALVWSKAPGAMRAHTQGATIRAKGGRFLAVPSDQVRALRGSRNQPMPTPADVERRLGVELVLVQKRGKRFLLAPSRDRVRRRTGPGRLFVAFFLIPQAIIRKRLDLPPLVQASMTQIRAGMAEALARVEARITPR